MKGMKGKSGSMVRNAKTQTAKRPKTPKSAIGRDGGSCKQVPYPKNGK